jgi:hypothetical protein
MSCDRNWSLIYNETNVSNLSPTIASSCWLIHVNLVFHSIEPNTRRFSCLKYLSWKFLECELAVHLWPFYYTPRRPFKSTQQNTRGQSIVPRQFRLWLCGNFQPGFHFCPSGNWQSCELLAVRNQWWTDSCLRVHWVLRKRSMGLHQRCNWKRYRLSWFSSVH